MEPGRRDRAGAAELVQVIASGGFTDERILAAIAAVPRRLFLAAPYQPGAYADRALPIECGQTMSAPSTTATLAAALEVTVDHKVLEVGCGSGYQAAVLGQLAQRVYTLDRYRTLVDLAEDRIALLKTGNVQPVHADGFDGHAKQAPYDRILVDGAVERIPPALMDQLADRGVLVAPVGGRASQTLVRVVRDGRLFHRTEIGEVRFIPLVEGLASRL